jgi:S-formylglutathione hydrolase FrmB
MKKNKKNLFSIFALLLLLINTIVCAQKIQTTYSSTSFAGPFSGKVILYLSKDYKTPKDLTSNFPAFCCFAITVKDIKPNTTVVFDDAAVAYPEKISDIERGIYYAQVVWDRNTGGRNIGNSPDNMYNTSVKINLTKNFNETFSIRCDSIIQHQTFQEMPFMKELKVHSNLLTAFYKRETTVNGAVNLPAEYYTDSTRKFPVQFITLGYGGDYMWNSGLEVKSWPLDSFANIMVILDGNCPYGHCTYANSANNGPWGDALVNEFIPALEKKFRCNGARLVTGHSSGGWTSLWLQINYPKTFAGCWASSPDPVDFRCLERINLYEDKNMFYDSDSVLSLDGEVGGFLPWIFLKDDYRIENVLYRGEQYMSWNAVWGMKNKNGTPESICDMNTGAIDSAVVSHWKNYDISLFLRNHWTTLQPDIDDKIRITAGNSDNFALNKSVKLLEEEMKKLNSHFEFAYYPGDHFTVWTNDNYEKDGNHFLAEKYEEWLMQHPEEKK